MSMLANIAGFAAFGLGVRFWQLGLQKRNMFSGMTGHVFSMAAFGYGGYLAWKWDIVAGDMIAKKKAEIAENRQARLARAEAIEEKLMAQVGGEQQQEH